MSQSPTLKLDKIVYLPFAQGIEEVQALHFDHLALHERHGFGDREQGQPGHSSLGADGVKYRD